MTKRKAILLCGTLLFILSAGALVFLFSWIGRFGQTSFRMNIAAVKPPLSDSKQNRNIPSESGKTKKNGLWGALGTVIDSMKDYYVKAGSDKSVFIMHELNVSTILALDHRLLLLYERDDKGACEILFQLDDQLGLRSFGEAETTFGMPEQDRVALMKSLKVYSSMDKEFESLACGKFLKSRVPCARTNSAMILGTIGSDTSLKCLDSVGNDSDSGVRNEIKRAIEKNLRKNGHSKSAVDDNARK